MKKLLLFIFLSLAAFKAMAQQQHHYSQFMYNKLYINPAYAGARGVPAITAIYRNQWAGFDGAPKSMLASVNTPFFSPRVGLGVTVSHLNIGLNRDFMGSMAYSYDLVDRDNMSFRIGLNASIRSLSVDFSKAKPKPGQGPWGDPSIVDARESNILGNVGAGVYALFSQRIYVGFSVPRIYGNTMTFNSNPAQGIKVAKEEQHYYGQAGAILPIGKDLNLMPAILVKYVQNAPVNADINLNLDVRQKFTAGISYRTGGDGTGDSVDMLAFFQATPQLGIGASYDFALSKLRDQSAGSFEILMQYEIKKTKKGMSNPRFFM
jgi:type IX secretion system PorP/SprF family membrane protein